MELGSFMSQWCNEGKEMYKIARCTSCCLSIKTYYFFAVLLAVNVVVCFDVIQK